MLISYVPSKLRVRIHSCIFAIVVLTGFLSTVLAQDVWTAVSPAPITDDLKAITYANGLYVAVGTNGAIITSSDAVTWTTQTSGISSMLLGVTANNSTFVAVGELGTILTSPDGITWTSQVSNTTNDLHGVTWNGSIFITAGNSSTALASVDGITWINLALEMQGITTDIYGITFGNGQFVIAGFDGMGGTISSSTDGVTWTSYTANAPDGFFAVSWLGGKYAAGTSGIFSSSDGIAWNVASTNTANFVGGFTGNTNLAIAVGSSGTIATSTDSGNTWSDKTSGVTVSLTGVTISPTTIVAVGEGGTILVSSLPSAIHFGHTSASINANIHFNIDHGIAHFTLNSDVIVTLQVYTIQGKLCANLEQGLLHKGYHSFQLPQGIARGEYIANMKINNAVTAKSIWTKLN